MAASSAVTWEDTPPDTSPSERTAQIAALTGLRGFAAMMVVLVHASSLTSFAWVGLPSYGPVSLFVLSGFLLYRPWAKWGLQSGVRPALVSFLRRRMTRILPAYLVVFIAIALVHAPSRPSTTRDWLSMVTLTWVYEDRLWPASFLQTWTLAVELAWYVALPIMAAVTTALARSAGPRRGFWVTGAMLMLSIPVSVLWRVWASAEDSSAVPHNLWLPGYLACFAGGALVAHLAEGGKAGVVRLDRIHALASDRWSLLVFATGLALLSTSSLGGAGGFAETFAQDQLRFVCATLIALTLLIVAALGSPRTPLNRVLSSRAATAIGRWSYGIFLWHFPVLVMLDDSLDYVPGALGLLARLGLLLAISVPLGAATYVWVEKPAITWSRRREARRLTAPQAG